MKPIFQTIFDFKHGDCMRACVASIFELSLEEVPNFNDPDSSYYAKNLEKWGSERGITAVNITLTNDDLDVIKNCWVIAVGKSPRDKNEEDRHAVVWYNGKVVHDPHPRGIGIKGKPEVYTIFILKDPIKYKREIF